jgi:hypothetical protein
MSLAHHARVRAIPVDEPPSPRMRTSTAFVCVRVLRHPMLVIQNQQHFDEVVTFAKKAGLYEPAAGTDDTNSFLKNRLDYLEHYGKSDATRV